MPIYEYRCDECGHAFEMIRSVSQSDQELHCPICKSPNAKRLMSVFSSCPTSDSSSAGSAPSCRPGPEEVLFHATDGNFDPEILKSDIPTMVDFWAPWCGPCHVIAPVVEELAKEYAGKVKMARMNVDENPATPSRYGIRGIPTLILFKNGQVFDQIVGAVPKSKVEEMIKKAL